MSRIDSDRIELSMFSRIVSNMLGFSFDGKQVGSFDGKQVGSFDCKQVGSFDGKHFGRGAVVQLNMLDFSFDGKHFGRSRSMSRGRI